MKKQEKRKIMERKVLEMLMLLPQEKREEMLRRYAEKYGTAGPDGLSADGKRP